jgi:hypothetical protein
MTTPELLILDPRDRVLYNNAVRKLKRIDSEICRHRQSFLMKHQIHIQAVLHFLLLDILALEIQAKDVNDKNLRIELRGDIAKQKQWYYELHDEVQNTIFLN